MEIKQIGEKIAHSLSDFFNDQKNLKALDDLTDKHDFKISNSDFEGNGKENKPLEGITVVITGTLPKPRNEVEEMIETLGGHTSTSVSKNTDYVISGENPGSKLKKAQELKIKIISYDELLEIIEQRTF
jgi:DNA ligase (NAD+)